MDNFAEALDRLITEWKQKGADVGEMAADMRGATEGLEAELDDAADTHPEDEA